MAKLSERQEACLVTLADIERKYPGRWSGPGYYRMRTNTLESLVKLGLVERRHRFYSLEYEYRITPVGLDVLG